MVTKVLQHLPLDYFFTIFFLPEQTNSTNSYLYTSIKLTFNFQWVVRKSISVLHSSVHNPVQLFIVPERVHAYNKVTGFRPPAYNDDLESYSSATGWIAVFQMFTKCKIFLWIIYSITFILVFS